MTQPTKPGAVAEDAKLGVVAKPAEAPKPSYADVPAIAVATKSAAMLEAGKYSKGSVLEGIASLLLEGELADETDRPLINAAVEFVKNPTDNLQEIQLHTTAIGTVCGGYEMQGSDTPPAIDALHAHLFSLQCINRINFIESEMVHGRAESRETIDSFVKVADWATTLFKGYKDESMLNAVNDLVKVLGELSLIWKTAHLDSQGKLVHLGEGK